MGEVAAENVGDFTGVRGLASFGDERCGSRARGRRGLHGSERPWENEEGGQRRTEEGNGRLPFAICAPQLTARPSPGPARLLFKFPMRIRQLQSSDHPQGFWHAQQEMQTDVGRIHTHYPCSSSRWQHYLLPPVLGAALAGSVPAPAVLSSGFFFICRHPLRIIPVSDWLAASRRLARSQPVSLNHPRV
jgi:hypothetical protein